MNLADLVRAEVAGVTSSATSRDEQEHSSDEKTLVEEELVETSVKVESDSVQPRAGKKGGRMLVTGKAHHSLTRERLIDTAVSASKDIQDNLRELVRTHLDKGVSFLELEYQP